MADHYTVTTLRDHSGELSAVKVYNGAITGASLAGFLANYGDLKTAIAGITLGELATDQWVGDRTVLSAAFPASAFAQRELKWLVQYHGNTTGKKFTCEIPTADLTGRVIQGTDLADLTNTEMAAFVTAFQTIARTPDDDTETVTIDAIRVVGRNI